MATEIDAARLLTWRAGWMLAEGIPFARGEGSMAKLFAADMAMRVTTEAVQVLGGYGYIKEYPVERFMRDAKAIRSGRGPPRSSTWSSRAACWASGTATRTPAADRPLASRAPGG